MGIKTELMIAIRSGCALGRMAESEVIAIVEHLEKLGWTSPSPAPIAPPAVIPIPAPPVPAVTATK